MTIAYRASWPVPARLSILSKIYTELRVQCCALEELLASEEAAASAQGLPVLSEKDRKELDKAVTVMKVGFKTIKRTLKRNEVVALKAPVVSEA